VLKRANDSDIYVAEVAQTALSRSGRYRPDFAALKKFVRL